MNQGPKLTIRVVIRASDIQTERGLHRKTPPGKAKAAPKESQWLKEGLVKLAEAALKR
jgi:hypothetical protein